MKIVWIVNIAMADACVALGKPAPVIGGWLMGYQNMLLHALPSAELHIIAPYWGNSTLKLETITPENIKVNHHLFPNSWIEARLQSSSTSRHHLIPISNRMEVYFSEVYEEIKPDIVHLHGIEAPHARAWIDANGCNNTIASIQGIAFECAQLFFSGLTERQLIPSFSDLRHGYSLRKEQQKMLMRGLSEVALLGKIEHVAGRTQWDHNKVLSVNPKLNYHVLQEVLRQEFYDLADTWRYEQCHSHSILIGQSHYPIKGLHQFLKAVPTLIEQYPDLSIRIVGNDLTSKHWWQRTTYGNVLHKLVMTQVSKGKTVKDHITYLGSVDANTMVAELQKANVFVCPSSIENSCNSVCEAQMIGTPVVAADVGGMATLITNGSTGLLYEFQDTKTMTHHISQIFSNPTEATEMSKNATLSAQQRHNIQEIKSSLLDIYRIVQNI